MGFRAVALARAGYRPKVAVLLVQASAGSSPGLINGTVRTAIECITELPGQAVAYTRLTASGSLTANADKAAQQRFAGGKRA